MKKSFKTFGPGTCIIIVTKLLNRVEMKYTKSQVLDFAENSCVLEIFFLTFGTE